MTTTADQLTPLMVDALRRLHATGLARWSSRSGWTDREGSPFHVPTLSALERRGLVRKGEHVFSITAKGKRCL